MEQKKVYKKLISFLMRILGATILMTYDIFKFPVQEVVQKLRYNSSDGRHQK